MILAIITILTAFLMEGIGSYMSVVGWASLLVGDWVVIALFIILDLAKIVTVSFLYQTWKEINTEIAERMVQLRKRKKLSQKSLALRSGVSLGSLKRFEQTGEISL